MNSQEKKHKGQTMGKGEWNFLACTGHPTLHTFSNLEVLQILPSEFAHRLHYAI
jgi:hypothetical protein